MQTAPQDSHAANEYVRHIGKALQVARPNWSELPDPSARVAEVARTAQKPSKSPLEGWLGPCVCDSSLRVEALLRQ